LLKLSWTSVSAERVFFGLCALMIVSALLLGGGTRTGFLSDALLQLLAVPLVLLCLWRLADFKPDKRPWGIMAFCLAIVSVPLLQLVPLPPSIWTVLPNRESVAEVFALLGRELPWRPISVSPHATWLSVLSLLVPLAIFLGTFLLDYCQRRLLSLIVIAVGVLSVFIGLTQVAAGPNSWLRFFAFTNTSEAVGFFANRNHFAALLYAVTMFAAVWAVDAALSAGPEQERGRYAPASIVPLIAGFTVLVMLVAAQAMARSRAGLGLTIFALLGAYAITIADRRSTSGMTPTKLLIGATALAVIFAAQFALYRIMERFAIDPLKDARLPFARTTMEAAQAYMPFGSGMGTFVPVYAMFEKPQDVLANTYANRAHNDILELWLEAGVFGLALMGVFAIWFIERSWEIWRRAPQGLREIDLSLARAATIVVALLIAHSFVDYPLRTGAMMAMMAFACALMLKPPLGAKSTVGEEAQSGREVRRSKRPGRKISAVPPATPRPSPRPLSTVPETPTAPSRPTRKQWGKDIEWPEQWSKPKKPGDPDGDDKKT
jgi:O-antigen ligase